MAYTYEGTSSFDPATNRVTRKNSAMDDAYDNLVKAIAQSNARPRTKALDTSKMNKVYKPKSSPGPNTLNLYGAAKPRLGGNANAREDRKPKKPNFTYSAPKPDKAKPNLNRANARENRVPTKTKPKAKASKTVAGFTKGSIGEKAISSFKKAYQGK